MTKAVIVKSASIAKMQPKTPERKVETQFKKSPAPASVKETII